MFSAFSIPRRVHGNGIIFYLHWSHKNQLLSTIHGSVNIPFPWIIWVHQPTIMVPPNHSILIRFSLINHPFWRFSSIFINSHMGFHQPTKTPGCRWCFDSQGRVPFFVVSAWWIGAPCCKQPWVIWRWQFAVPMGFLFGWLKLVFCP